MITNFDQILIQDSNKSDQGSLNSSDYDPSQAYIERNHEEYDEIFVNNVDRY